MRVAVIGFGFSGAMVVANLVRHAKDALIIYVLADALDARGVAYSTTNPEHLLNVRASNMSAWANDVSHLSRWLISDAARAAQATLGLKGSYGAGDFIPRALYGAYLQDIWHETQEIATQKQLRIKLVPSRAVAVGHGTEMTVHTQRGDAIAVDRVVLAVGHEMRPVLTYIPSAQIIQNPRDPEGLQGAAQWSSPVMLMGVGLTAVDMLLSLRKAGYVGEVIACSRRGLLPQAHQPQMSIFSFTPGELAAPKTLSQWLRLVRQAMVRQEDWRVVIDALRPHTQRLWQGLGAVDQRRFLSRVLPLWNVHRHRMAPEIAARVAEEMAEGGLRILASKRLQVMQENDQLVVTAGDTMFHPSRIINCTGLELDLARSAQPLLRQMLAEGMLEPHANGLGIAVDTYGRAWGSAYPQLHVVGSWITGQWLESTAVPELREQAAQVARTILPVEND